MLVGCWGAWAAIRLLGLDGRFPLTPMITFTPYVALAAVIPIGVALALRRWIPAVAAVVVLGYLLSTQMPRVLTEAAAEGHSGPRLRIVSANIHHGTADMRSLVDLVREKGADVLSIPELTPSAAKRLRRRGLAALLPYRDLSTRRGASGGGLYSRFPLRSIPTMPFQFKTPRAIMQMPSGLRVEVVCVHPLPPDRPGSVDDWRHSLESLPSAGEWGPLRLLAGDFNATLDHSDFRAVLDRGYRDAGDALGDGLTPTWPAGGSLLPPPITIDHVLVDSRAGIEAYSVHDLPGSDHRAIYAEISLGPESS